MKCKIIFLFCLAPLFASSQIVVTANGVLSISPGATFYAAGDFTNNGQVLNNGSLNISGAWTNTGDYQAEAGQVDFNGKNAQIINHNAQSFAKLIISGGGQKTFKADITITESLVLTDGVLFTDTDSKIVLAENASVSGSSANSFVEGRVNAIGAGTKLFPVGVNSTYLPLTLTNVAGTTPEVGVQVFQPNDYTTHGDDLSKVSDVSYWKIENVSNFSGSESVTIGLANESFSDQDRIVVAQSSRDGDPFVSLGRSAFTGSETSGTVTSDLALQATGTTYVAAAELNGDKSVVVYNAVTPNGDGVHDYLKITNIEQYPGNSVVIVNRWGDKVFSTSDYANDTAGKCFIGESNVGGSRSLTDGTYFYVLDKNNGDKKMSGFLILKR